MCNYTLSILAMRLSRGKLLGISGKVTAVGRLMRCPPSLSRKIASYPVDLASQETGVYKMPKIEKNPFSIFKTWYEDQKSNHPDNHIAANALCLSTSTRDGKVSARSLIMRRLDDDGFVIMTDNRSKKSKELAENPRAAMTFLWVAVKNGKIHSRQVRAEGDIKELEFNEWRNIFEDEPLFCKIRALVCHQGSMVDWDNLKSHHDTILTDFKEGKLEFRRPDYVVAYKLFPAMMEFYESSGPTIADRVMYLKQGDEWGHWRIAA